MGGVLGAIGWMAGVVLQLQQAELWSVAAYAALAAASLACAIGAWAVRRRASASRGLIVAATLCLAFATTGLRGSWRIDQQLSAALEGQDLQVTGLIVGLPQQQASGTRFTFEVEAASLRGTAVRLPPLLGVAWYREADSMTPPSEVLRAGQRWVLTLRLKAPHGNLNPHGFDLELWLFEQGIGASGYVRAVAGAVNRKLDDSACCRVQQLRQSLRDAIERWVDDRTAAGVLAALVVGDQAAIDRDDWELFRLTGVAHLMSISGLHVTMFAWLAGGLVGHLWRRSPRLVLRLATPHAARWGGLVCATLYALLAGWGVPAQRTVWMIAGVVLLRTVGWRWPQHVVLAVAGAVVTLVDPWAMLQPGFWLSFVAVGLLIGSEAVLTPRTLPAGWRQRFIETLRGGLRTQLIATVGLTPLTLLFFQQVSLVGFVANLLAIPLVTLLVTPLALAGALLPWLWGVAAALVTALMAALQVLAQLPVAVWTAAAAPTWAAAAGLLGGALLVLPLPWRLRLLGAPLMLPLLVPPLERPPPGEFEAVVADVGQGTAVLVRTAQHLLVYDAGPSYSRDSDAGHRVLLPLLRARGEQHIDRLMLSHRDSDHVGGAAALLNRGAVRSLTSSLEASHPLLQGRTPHEPCAAGQRWAWDGVRFEVLHPLPGEAGAAVKPNWISCTLRIESAGATPRSLLLTGDLEAPQEAALVQRLPVSTLRADVMVVPHHGSRTSSTAAFLDAVAPQVAVVQAGYRSRFGHPAPDVVQRYLDRGVRLERSDRCGAWAWRTADDAAAPGAGAGPSGVCERQAARRYWHHRPQPGS